MRIFLLGLAMLWVVASPVSAQNDFGFPYELHTAREVTLSSVGAATLVASFIAQRSQDPLSPAEVAALDPDDVNSFDRSATDNWSTSAASLSDVLQVIQIASPLLLVSGGRGKDNAGIVLMMYAESLLLVNGLSQLSKGVTSRTRPYPYNDDPDIPEELKLEVDAVRSFPSGHTINAFNSAVFLGTVYSKMYPESSARKWVWLSGLAVATTTGTMRYVSGKHFPTDIITGVLTGSAIGFLIPKLHEVKVVDLGFYPVESGVGFSVARNF